MQWICKNMKIEEDNIKIALLGASFDTGNMGVNALAESSIKCNLHRWKNAEIKLLGTGRAEGQQWVKIQSRKLCLKKVSIRFCGNAFLRNHFRWIEGFNLIIVNLSGHEIVRSNKSCSFSTFRNLY